jgi:Tol biopolymer transport system component
MRVDLNVPASVDPFSTAVSPDGLMLAFVAAPDGQPRLWLRQLDQSTATPLPGTEGAVYPFWSPDSRSIAFFAGSDLKRINLDDRVAQVLTGAIPGNGGSWGADGQILYAPTPGSGLFRIPSSGGEPVAVTRAEGTRGFGHRFPQLLPDGRRFLFYLFTNQADRGIYVASFDEPDQARRVTPSDGAGLYVEPGWLLFAQQGTLVARRFDITSAGLSGDPIVIAEGVSTNGASAPAFSASRNGIITYAVGGINTRLTWFDRAGTPLGTLGSADAFDLVDPEISPDGSRVAVTRESRNNADIWIYRDTAGTRMTLGPSNERYPVWSPDGNELLFQSDRNGSLDLHVASSATPGRERVLMESFERKFPSDWSPDGLSAIYFQVRQRDAQSAAIDLWLRSFGADASEREWLAGDATELWPQSSQTGEFVAYYSTESGTSQEVYVRRFANVEDRWAISTGGGIYPRWSRDGRELYYIDPEGRLMAVSIQIKGTELVPGTPKELFRPRVVGGGLNRVGYRQQYDVHPDGRFLINVETGGSTSSISLLLNWNPER